MRTGGVIVDTFGVRAGAGTAAGGGIPPGVIPGAVGTSAAPDPPPLDGGAAGLGGSAGIVAGLLLVNRPMYVSPAALTPTHACDAREPAPCLYAARPLMALRPFRVAARPARLVLISARGARITTG